MTATELTPHQKTLVDASATLKALADVLGDEEEELLVHVSKRLTALAAKLWDLADEV